MTTKQNKRLLKFKLNEDLKSANFSKCLFCKLKKARVTLRHDPYDYELSDVEDRPSLKKYLICNDCYGKRCEEI